MNEIPDDAWVVLWYGPYDLGGGLNGVFTVVVGKHPQWHRDILPAINRLSRRLTGKKANGRIDKHGLEWKLVDNGFSGAETQELGVARKFWETDRHRFPDQRRKWVIWDGKDFIDMEIE